MMPTSTSSRSSSSRAVIPAFFLSTLLRAFSVSLALAFHGAQRTHLLVPSVGSARTFGSNLLANSSNNGNGEVTANSESAAALEQAKSAAEKYFGLDVGIHVLEFVLEEHKPLGCTAEESLVEEDDGSKHVFVSKVKKGGNAGKAGIKEGDVVIAATGSFEDVMIVAGLGLEKVRPLIAGHPENEHLTIFVARGTDVQAKHDTMLVDICTFNEGLDSKIEECIVDLNTYDMSFDDEEPTVDCGDEDTECLLDQMYGNWEDGLSGLFDESDDKSNSESQEDVEETKKKKIAPWSSRSSPSGTFVRDPKSGKMVNIDA